ncbi:polycystin-1-like protein 1 [Ascaphus truei]|uniref:polycystin-1-like protein 1 n=1 Tax=Ascaphus truei TaxID=8439 RepID=UPI003F5942B6
MDVGIPWIWKISLEKMSALTLERNKMRLLQETVHHHQDVPLSWGEFFRKETTGEKFVLKRRSLGKYSTCSTIRGIHLQGEGQTGVRVSKNGVKVKARFKVSKAVLREDENVVQVNYHKRIENIAKMVINKVLKNSQSVTQTEWHDQEEMTDVVSMLTDLLNIRKQVTVESALLIIDQTMSIVKRHIEPEVPGRILLKRKLAENFILLISRAMEVFYNYSERTTHLMLYGFKSISDLMLKYITLNNKLQFNIATNLMELQINIHQNFNNNIQTIGSTKFHLPQLQDRDSRNKTALSNKCYISQLVYFKKNPYFWATASSQPDGEFAGLSLFNCSNRRKIKIRDVVMPVTMEFGNKINHDAESNKTRYLLVRDKVHFHLFNVIPKNKEEGLQITMTFSTPHIRAFPVLILLRFSEKPSTAHFNIKEIYSWEGTTSRIFIPADSIKGREYGYLSLMDADYNRWPKNKYLSKVINYTIDVQWTQCLYWDNNKEWKSEDCYPQKGTTAARVNCRITADIAKGI